MKPPKVIPGRQHPYTCDTCGLVRVCRILGCDGSCIPTCRACGCKPRVVIRPPAPREVRELDAPDYGRPRRVR